ncbi:MAG: hypothetical protein JWP32_2664 [Schumannella sp.]|nr:hypothetical protein [Schumannella sp.]
MTSAETPSLQDLCVPDDSGRDAFERFRYQAQVAFKHCLQAARGQEVLAITCEHIEDLVIEETARLRFVQIKTRNADYGLWRFADLCKPRGGALSSLLRTHQALKNLRDPRDIVFEVRLEGATKRGDSIQRLLVGGDGADEEMARSMASAMRPATKITLKEARAILKRVVVTMEPPREHIAAQNLRTLAAAGGRLTVDDVQAVQAAVIALICDAMEGTLLADHWPSVLFEPVDAADERAMAVAGKRLTVEALAAVLRPILSASSIEIWEVVEDGEEVSAMIDKLRLAGAGDDLLQRARTLRAAATRRELEVRSRDSTGRAEADFADLDQRLLSAAVISAAVVGQVDKPAPSIFAELFDRLAASPAAFDPNRLMEQDALALVGGVLQLSDECLFSWRADA